MLNSGPINQLHVVPKNFFISVFKANLKTYLFKSAFNLYFFLLAVFTFLFIALWYSIVHLILRILISRLLEYYKVPYTIKGRWCCRNVYLFNCLFIQLFIYLLIDWLID